MRNSLISKKRNLNGVKDNMMEDVIVPPAFLQQIFETIRQVDAKELQVSNEKGKFKGREEATREFVQRMFDKGFSLKQICDASGLSHSEIMDLKKEF